MYREASRDRERLVRLVTKVGKVYNNNEKPLQDQLYNVCYITKKYKYIFLLCDIAIKYALQYRIFAQPYNVHKI